jgi:integrase
VPRNPRGSAYRTTKGWGVRWVEGERRPQKAGFASKRDALRYFADEIEPRLRHGTPDAGITFDAFCDVFLDRHDGADSTVETLRERLAPARKRFGDWPLRDLEGAADDIAQWRSRLVTESARYRHTRALRECLAAAVRWRYLARNPAVEAGRNPEPRSEELRPFTRAELDALALELGPVHGSLVIVTAETGLRTNEFPALERRDIDRAGAAVVVQRRFARGKLTPYPKTQRRRIPLTTRALAALDALPPRLDTPLLFPAPEAGYLNLDNWRMREWYPALTAAGIERRGPYHLRHTFATEALAAGMSIFQLARVMGASVNVIDRYYGHLAHDSEAAIRALLDTRAIAAASAQE